jgi:hypothetical protein
MNTCRSIVVLALCVTAAACSTRVIHSDDGPPVYRLYDGGACVAPAGYADIINGDGARQVRALFRSSSPPADIVASISDLPERDEIETAFYESCGEYANGELSADELERQRRIYHALRLEHLVRGVQRWREDPQGYGKPGKICHLLFNHDRPDRRNLTRVVPEQTSVDDCALYVHENGGTHVRLGCTEGRWDIRWAAQPLRVGAAGWINRRQAPAGTRYVPEPNCDWR